MGEQYGEKLREDPALLRKIIDSSSVENMQCVFNEAMHTLVKGKVNTAFTKSDRNVECHFEPPKSIFRIGRVPRNSAREMEVGQLRFIDGLCIRAFFPETLIRSAMAYSPRPDDVFVVSYPKCGTTWTQYLILSILTDGEPPTNLEDFMLASPYMEMMGAEAAEKMRRPGLLKTHLPFETQPYSKQAKYIYVARNPYDVCVSYYYFLKSMTPKRVKDVSFSRFHQLFVSGSVSYGDYFDHLLSWYKHRHDDNVLFF
ncbi:hypothetical protein MTO96_032114 [Rhipicephalus appendiculatus]